MYVGPFAGKQGKQSAGSATNVFYRAADEFAEVNVECVCDFEQHLQTRRATVVLKKAHAGLGDVCISRELRHGRILFLPLLGKQFGDSAADFVVVIVPWHDVPVAKNSR